MYPLLKEQLGKRIGSLVDLEQVKIKATLIFPRFLLSAKHRSDENFII